MSSFFQDLPGPIRERRASLPAAAEGSLLDGGAESDDRFFKKVAEEPGYQGYPDLVNPPRPRLESRGKIDDFDQEFAAGEALDDRNIWWSGGVPSSAPHRYSNYRKTIRDGEEKLIALRAHENAADPSEEKYQQNKVNKRMKYRHDGRAISSKDPAVAGLDPDRPDPKPSTWNRLFNMKSGFANPLAWLYQAGKGIGKGLSSLFGGGAAAGPKTVGDDDHSKALADERAQLQGIIGPKRIEPSIN